MKKLTRGFTLIELLVVIAIIGVLASIVLVSLNGARKKGADARVISDVQEIRTALESGYNGSGYPDVTNIQTSSFVLTQSSGCNAGYWNNGGSQNVAISALVNDACSQEGNTPNGTNSAISIIVNNNTVPISQTGGYLIQGYQSSTGTWFCIDNTGKAVQSDTVKTASATAAPGC